MSYIDDGPSNLGASGGPTGGLPQDMYLRKIEVTNFYEDPDMLENHYRSTLTDWGPESATLASDQIRSSDDRGSGFQSESRLSLRHSGGRSSEDPYLPDGFFDGHIGGMTDRDPRGHALGPNMRKHVEQQYARADLIRFYDDSDNSIPSTGINPAQMVTNVRSLQKHFKDRFQNFDTAFDAWHNGGTDNGTGRGHGSSVAKYTHDGTIMDLTEAEQGNRTDATARLSADPQVAYRHSTPDHRFKVAKYGAVRVKQFLNDSDLSNNRMSTFQDHNNLVAINGTMVNRSLANLIIDLEGLRETKQDVAKGADYGESRNTHVRAAKLSPSDVYKIMMIDMSSPVNANTEHFSGKMMHRNPGKLTHDHRSLMENAEFNHEIADVMRQATRSSRNLSEDDVRGHREQVVQSAGISGLFNHQGNRRASAPTTNLLNRESTNNHAIEDAKTTMNYAGLTPSDSNRVMEKLDGESYAKFSRKTLGRHGMRDGATPNRTYNNEYDQNRDLMDFGTYDRADRADPNEHVGRDFNHMAAGDSSVTETDIMGYL